ncbi:MAG: sensor domain-containing protein, partial [Phycisphaerae bacterium]
MIDQSNTPKPEPTGKIDNPSIPDLRDLCEERPFCPWLLAGFFFVVPFLLWLLLSKEASASMSQLDLAVQAAVATLALLMALVSWEALRFEPFQRRIIMAVLFLAGALLSATQLTGQGYWQIQSPFSHQLLINDLGYAAELLIAVAVLLSAKKSTHPINIRMPRSNIMLWILGIPLAAAALLLTTDVHAWIAGRIQWEQAWPVIVSLFVLGIYGVAITMAWRSRRNNSAGNTADYILAALLLLAAGISRFAALIRPLDTALLAQFYQVAGLAWLLRYVFMVGFREPHQRLMQSEAQFRTLFEKSGEVTLLLDVATGKIMDSNEAAVEFYGYSAEKLKSLRIWNINTLPEATVRERMEQVTSGSRVHYAFRHRLNNGEIRDVDAYSVALNLGGRATLYVVVRDDTERKKALADLLLFRQAIEASTNGITIADALASDTPIIYVNPAFEKLTGYTLDEVRGKNPRLLQGPAHGGIGREEIRAAIKAQRPVQAILKNYRKDGTPYWCEVNISPVRDPHGVVTQWVGIQSDITARRAAEEKLEYLAFYDPLTGIANRRLLLDRIEQAMTLAKRNGNYGALVFLDLDHFKQVNDVQGHEVGDALLMQIVDRVRKILRESDTVGRIGGDEFVILLPNLSPDRDRIASELLIVLQRISQLLSEPVKIGPAEYSVTVSMGVTVFPQENVTSSELIAQADIAMYRAKESGRNTTCYFEPAMQEQIKERAALSKDLREALSHGDFRVFLQPQVDRTGRIIGAEALIRWQHQQGGLIAPAKFIPIAEDTGLIVPMGEFMLREACNIMRQLERADITFRLSVNVSLRQFKLVDFAERIIAIVKASEINPASLTLEITESVLLH